MNLILIRGGYPAVAVRPDDRVPYLDALEAAQAGRGTAAFERLLYERLDATAGLDFLDNEGAGLYRLQSAANHSCVPNAQVEFRDGDYRLSMVATRAIAPGEEIEISYLDECQLAHSRHTRAKYLRENYLFDCACERCLRELEAQPDETSEEESDEEEDCSMEDA